MDVTLNVLKILEEYGKWKTEIFNTYGLDSGETTKLSGKIGEGLREAGLQDTRHIRDPG
jgi:hypothetical protein